MRPFRDLKIASLITEELGKIFTRDFNFEGALVTIMGIDVEKDLLHANIKLGIIPYEKSLDVYKIVSRAANTIRFQLLKKINIKPMPYLKFEIVEPEKAENSE